MESLHQASSIFYKNPSLVLINAAIDQTMASLRSRSMSLFLYFMLAFFFVRPCSSQAWDGVVITEADYQGLQAFKQELIDPKGFLRSWNDSGFGACSGGWSGIKCAQGEVIVIQLPWKSLGGRITDKIGQLQALRKLSLHDNQLGGSIPMSLGLIPNLRGVQLFNNRLSGSVPPSLGSSPLLQTLDLSNNLLSGFIPDSLANSTKLLRLNLSFNSLSGPIPVSLTRSVSLQFLALDHNNLSGSIPDTWGQAQSTSTNLRVLSLDHNSISGRFPASLGRLTELQDVFFSHNKISGVLPAELGNLIKLRTIDFSFNVISGSIPSTLGNISSLKHLDLSENKLTGEIPTSLADLNSLTFFNVSYNNLSGPVPSPLSEKFDSSSFVGNIQLCGYSVSTPCPSLEPPPPPETARKRPRGNLSAKDKILIASGSLLVVLFILVCILLCCLLRKKPDRSKAKGSEAGAAAAAAGARAEKGSAPGGGEGGEAGGEAGGKLVHFDGPMAFTADDLLCATAEIMGKSTYGTVYKATLEDGSQIAVKRLREKITKSQKEFENEVNVLGRIRHPNLLALRAYYLGPKGEKLVVFDYMPTGSLATYLHARGPEIRIDWPTRMKIIKDMARGLFYLHTHESIVHGNLTSSNVLLDENINAKIADHGLSRLMTAAAGSSVIATAGALGYRAPELSKLKKANTKTDVYSLGVIVLELLTGKSPSEALNGVDLPQWVASIVKEEWTNEVFDLELMRDANAITGDELLNTLKLALHCVDPTPSARPEAQQILQQLEEIRPEAEAASEAADPTGAAASTSQ